MPSSEEKAWTDREIDYPSRIASHHNLREETSFVLVEDTFRNVFYRFEVNETDEIWKFLNHPNWGPSKYAVHVIGAIIDVTEMFKRVKR